MAIAKVADVFITRRLPAQLLSQLEINKISYDIWDSDDPISYSDLLSQSQGRRAILCMLTDKIDENIVKNAGSQLKVISTMSVGYNHIDTCSLKTAGIRLGYTPGVLADATAELALALLLATSRRIVEGCKTVPSGKWKAWTPFWMCGKGLSGSTVGIIGLGTIGKKIAERIASFRPEKILYTGSGRNTEDVSLLKLGAVEYCAHYMPLHDLLASSDFVIVICVLNDKTKNLINDQTLAKMKPGSILINVSRGEVVDQDALFRALSKSKEGTGISAAGLDVCTPEPLPLNSPLLTLDNCVITPHLGSATLETRKVMLELSVQNIIAGLTDAKMPHEVEF